MRKRYVYRDGRMQEIRGGLIKTDWNEKPYADQIVRGYYDLECAGKYRPPADMNKAGIKKVWDMAREGR